MRHLSLVASIAFLVACGPGATTPTDDGGGGDGGGGDGGGGDGGGGDGGAAPSDAGTDAPPVDAFAAPPRVTVIVTDDDVPQPGAAVAWLDPAGTLLGEATTGADGRASFDLPEGGTVVAIPVAPTGPLQTFVWMGAVPGDEAPIVRRATPSTTSVATDVLVPPLAGAVRWQVDTECGVGAGLKSPLPVDIRDDCTRSDVVVTHLDASSGAAGTTVALDQPITPGSTLDLSTLTPLASTSATVALVGLTSDVTYAEISANAWFGSVRAPVGLDASASMPISPLTASGALPMLGTTGRLVEIARLAALGGRLVVERHEDAPSNIDLAVSRMPILTALAYDAPSRRVTLTFAGAGPVIADATYVELMAVGATGRALVWHVMSAAGDTLQLPALPATMADATIPRDATPSFAAYRLATPSTPDEVRQRAYTLSSLSDLLMGDGDLVYSPLASER